MEDDTQTERPAEGGAHPVVERPPEPPIRGWSIGQTLVVVIAAVAIVVAILWLIVPFGA